MRLSVFTTRSSKNATGHWNRVVNQYAIVDLKTAFDVTLLNVMFSKVFSIEHVFVIGKKE